MGNRCNGRRSHCAERIDRFRSSGCFQFARHRFPDHSTMRYWPFAISYPRAVSSRATTSPVSVSTFCCFKRLPVFRLIRLKLTFRSATTPDRGRSDTRLAIAEGNPSSSHAGPCDTPQQHISRCYIRNFTNCFRRRTVGPGKHSVGTGGHGTPAGTEPRCRKAVALRAQG